MNPGDRFWDFVHRGEDGITRYHPLWVVVDIKTFDRHMWEYILATPSNASDNPWVARTSARHRYVQVHGRASEDRLQSVAGLYDSTSDKEIPIV